MGIHLSYLQLRFVFFFLTAFVIAFAYFHLANHFSVSFIPLPCNKKKKRWCVQSYLFALFARSLSGTFVLWILYFFVVPLSLSTYPCLCLFLSCTHIFACDSFFQFSLVLLPPSPSLPFSPLFFPSLPLSLAPLLSPSERLRIPKGADAIKMLILSVYRERERGG